jgi:hypothetical protein
MLKEGGQSQQEQIRFANRLLIGRDPTSAEVKTMMEFCRADEEGYKKNPDKAKSLLAVGVSKTDDQQEARLAAYTNLALSMMNTDEFLTRK